MYSIYNQCEYCFHIAAVNKSFSIGNLHNSNGLSDKGRIVNVFIIGVTANTCLNFAWAVPISKKCLYNLPLCPATSGIAYKVVGINNIDNSLS